MTPPLNFNEQQLYKKWFRELAGALHLPVVLDFSNQCPLPFPRLWRGPFLLEQAREGERTRREETVLVPATDEPYHPPLEPTTWLFQGMMRGFLARSPPLSWPSPPFQTPNSEL
jgi:hypothetical protein